MNWFAKMLQQYMDKKNLTQKQMGELLGVGQSEVSRWIANGGIRNVDKLSEIVSAIGGDIERASPFYNAPVELPESVKSPLKTLDSIEDEWKSSPFWSYGTGPFSTFRVKGNSMAPVFPNNSLLAIRRLSSPLDELPRFCPVIMRFDDGKEEARYLQVEVSRDGEFRGILGNAANHSYPTLFFTSRKEVEISHVVVGMFRSKVPVENLSNRLELIS